jgi:hypothetical protein
MTAASTRKQSQNRAINYEPVPRFSADINEAINAKQECLLQAEANIFLHEENYNDEQTFIKKFASGLQRMSLRSMSAAQ